MNPVVMLLHGICIVPCFLPAVRVEILLAGLCSNSAWFASLPTRMSFSFNNGTADRSRSNTEVHVCFSVL
eukprot:3006439-Amphidinium_carterae.1